MLTREDLDVPTVGWSPVSSEAAGTKRWSNAAGDLLSMDFFSIAPDLPSAVHEIEPIRALYRTQLGDQGAIIEVEPVEVGSIAAVRAIFKFPQSPTGMTYLGALTIPFRACSFVLKWQCPEQGLTGARDATVFALVKPTVDAQGQILDWLQDPYLPTHRARCLRNRADDPRWDAQFPNHPLSRVRSYLADLSSLRLSERAAREPPFSAPHQP